MRRFILALSLALAATASAEEGGLVALLPFDVANAQIDKATRTALEEAIRTVAGDALTPYGYTVLTGETTLSLLSDNNIDAAKACEASCALQAARELKAKIFISGTVTTSEGSQLAFIRVFESASGKQLASVQLEGDKVRDLRKEFAEKADAFFAKALGQKGAPVKTVPVATTPTAPTTTSTVVEAREPESQVREEPAPEPKKPVEPSTGPEKNWVVSMNVLSFLVYAADGATALDFAAEKMFSRYLSGGVGLGFISQGDPASVTIDVTSVNFFANLYPFGAGPSGVFLGAQLTGMSLTIESASGESVDVSGGGIGAYLGYQKLFGSVSVSALVGGQYSSASVGDAAPTEGSTGPILAARLGYAF